MITATGNGSFLCITTVFILIHLIHSYILYKGATMP